MLLTNATAPIKVKYAKSASINSASGDSWTYTLSRGSFLAWADAIVDWSSNGDIITNSEGHQRVGWVFPNIVKAKGITKINALSSATRHVYLSKISIGAGVVTPWGDVNVYETDFEDYIRVNYNGTATHW